MIVCPGLADVVSAGLSLGLPALCAAGSGALAISASAGDGIKPTVITSESAMERTQEAGLRMTAPFL